jgi:hypothetical protein
VLAFFQAGIRFAQDSLGIFIGFQHHQKSANQFIFGETARDRAALTVQAGFYFFGFLQHTVGCGGASGYDEHRKHKGRHPQKGIAGSTAIACWYRYSAGLF